MMLMFVLFYLGGFWFLMFGICISDVDLVEVVCLIFELLCLRLFCCLLIVLLYFVFYFVILSVNA